MKHCQTALCFLVPVALLGCAAPDPDRDALKGLDKAHAAVGASGRDPQQVPPVLIQGVAVPASDLAPRLEEAAGSVVLEEVVLGRLLDKAVADSGITISPKDIEAEQQAFAQTLTDEAKLSPEQALGVIESMRKSRGLGPVRFADLLARNAKLRVLARPKVEVSDAEIEQSLAAEFGPRLRIRMITVPSQRQAGDIKDTIIQGLTPAPDPAPDKPEKAIPQDPMLSPVHVAPADVPTVMLRFSLAALESSKDPTAPRGGLIPSISPMDQGLPSSVRNALGVMQPGDLSAVLSTEGGFMLVLYESKTEGKGEPTPEDRVRATDRVRSRKERIAMDRLARQLLSAANVSVLDPSLRWSWDSRPSK